MRQSGVRCIRHCSNYFISRTASPCLLLGEQLALVLVVILLVLRALVGQTVSHVVDAFAFLLGQSRLGGRLLCFGRKSVGPIGWIRVQVSRHGVRSWNFDADGAWERCP